MLWILLAVFAILPLALGITAFRASQRNKASLARAERSLQELKDRVASLEARGILKPKPQAQYRPSFEPAPSLTPEDFEAQVDLDVEFEASERYSPPHKESPPEPAAPEPVAPAYRLPKSPHEIAPPVKGPISQQLFDWRNLPGVSWLLGGNALVRVGVVVLFFGLSFLLKYATERLTFPPELRLGLVALGGFGLLGLGWKLRTERPGYGLSLQGGGVGLLYLVTYAAFRLYGLIPPTAAFAVMLLIVAGSGFLALRQNSMPLALLGALGGFLAPILASTGSGSHVTLFTYYVVLNAYVLWMAWTRAWRPLNLLGFFATFVVATVWGVLAYQASNQMSAQIFLMIFFLIYVGIAVLYALHRSFELKHYVDGTIVFGTPLVVFGLRAAMADNEMSMAVSAAGMAVFYGAIAFLLKQRKTPDIDLLVKSFTVIAVALATAAIPLAFDGATVAVVWALEGAAIVWVARRQSQPISAMVGLVLQPLAAFAWVAGPLSEPEVAELALLNSGFMGGLILAGSSWFIARELQRGGIEAKVGLGAPVYALLMFLWGTGLWVLTGARETVLFIEAAYRPAVFLATAAASLACFLPAWRGYGRYLGLVPVILMLPVLLVIAGLQLNSLSHPADDFTWAGWIAALMVMWWALRRHENDIPAALNDYLHLFTLFLFVGLLSWEVQWQAKTLLPNGRTWPSVAGFLVPTLFLFGLTRFSNSPRWPMSLHSTLYSWTGGRVLAVYVLSLWLGSIFSSGDLTPIPYVPLLNALDLTGLLAALVLWHWLQHPAHQALIPITARGHALKVASAVAFVWLNGVLLRTAHHWTNIAYEPRSLLGSDIVQAALSVFWTALAVIAMIWAVRKSERTVWWAGAGLLGVVVVKLFVFDLSQLEGARRIVSFLGVGGMLLAIGYFAPIPPSDKNKSDVVLAK